MSYVIKLRRSTNSMTVKRIARNVTLEHVGRRGIPGRGVPAGGTDGQHLVKDGPDDYNLRYQSFPNITVSSTAPTSPEVGDIWLETP